MENDAKPERRPCFASFSDDERADPRKEVASSPLLFNVVLI